jgi:hypothetical protein
MSPHGEDGKKMFGITENGDASLNYDWESKMLDMDGAILITKKLTATFKNKVIEYIHRPFIIHVSCTGYGSTVLEPNLDPYQRTIDEIYNLIHYASFPAERVVLRIDPIIPTEKGIKVFEEVVRYARGKVPEINRIRVSVMDMYPHVRKRFQKAGLPCPYGNHYFQASPAMFRDLNIKIMELKREFPELSFESCCETKLPATKATGCVSEKDYEILGLKKPDDSRKGQRTNCMCLGDKKDMLEFKYNETGYNHCYGCLYCYWQTEKDKE